jgi:hypothetical protein
MTRSRFAGALVAATATAALALAGAGTANASSAIPDFGNPGNGTNTMKNAVTGRCIDDSSGYGLRSIGCNGFNYQDFF